jgi:hypothetical protein
MSYYTTGTSFSLKTGTHLPRVIYNNNGITSGRTSGVIAPTDPQTNGPASTSVFMEASIDSNGRLNAEQLAEEFADKIEPHLSSVGSISTPHLSTSMLFLGLQAMSLTKFIRVAAYNGGYIASDASSFYMNSSDPSGSVKVFDGTGSLINSIDCSSNGTKIVGINYITKRLYFSTDSGKTFNTQSIGAGNYIQVRMTSDGNYFTVLDTDGKIYFYNINNNTITFSIRDLLAPVKNYPVKDELRCLSISSDGSKQFVFDQSGVLSALSINTSNIGTTTTPITNITETNYIKTPNNSSVVWDSCACSSNGQKQIAVGFKFINGVYDCYIFLTKDAWVTYTPTKITRRTKTIDSVNYETERASGTSSFMSSDGTKKWCIIDEQLYYCNTDNASDFALIQNPTGYFISYGTCSPDGSIIYLIKNDGSMWKSTDNGNTLIAL